MKFTDGYWLLREGVQAKYPTSAFDAAASEKELTVYAPFRPQTDRAGSVDSGMLTIRFSAPREGIIRVDVWHHMGGLDNHPEFELTCEDIRPGIAILEDKIIFTSGELEAVITRDPYKLEFFDAAGRKLTDSADRNLAYMTASDGKNYVIEQLKTSVGEYIYGLGERFTPFVKNGQIVEMWNEDGGTASEIAYKNIPFYLTNRGYGVLVNHAGRVFYEINSEKVSRVSFGIPGEHLSYCVIAGPTPEDVLMRYTALTGRAPILPPESFGVWLSTSFTTNYDEETTNSFIDGMRNRDIPLDVFHFDCFWMREFNWCDFTWDSRMFPDPEAMLKRYHEKGLKICVWINPYIAQRSPLFEEGKRAGYFIRRTDGSVWQWDRWQAGMAIVDFTNPDAVVWYKEKLRALLRMGVDYFKTDFGERIPADGVYYNGTDPEEMHNYYTYLYSKCVFELLVEEKGEGNACVFARSATVGGQKFPVHWGGDCSANFESMAETLRGGLSLAASGFAFWSHDISGFEQTATQEVYSRWAQFGMLSTHTRFHGSKSYRVPWNFGKICCDVVRRFAKLKCRLMPYIYEQSIFAHETGIPVMRPMFLAYPEDLACEMLDRQYMFGKNILAAPVFTESGDVQYYLPEGTWTHLLDGRTLEGGHWKKENYDLLSMPVFAAPNSMIPFGNCDNTAAYDFESNVTIHYFEPIDGDAVVCRIPNRRGEIAFTAEALLVGETLTLLSDAPCTFVIHHNGSIETVSCDGKTVIKYK